MYKIKYKFSTVSASLLFVFNVLTYINTNVIFFPISTRINKIYVLQYKL